MYQVVRCEAKHLDVEIRYAVLKDGLLVDNDNSFRATYISISDLVDSVNCMFQKCKELPVKRRGLKAQVEIKTLCTFSSLEEFLKLEEKYPELFI